MKESGRFAIAELTGGLGNQLFQYAAARALCLRERRSLLFAFHLHRSDTRRRFMLDAFQLAPDAKAQVLGTMRLCKLGLRSPLLGRKAGQLWRRTVCRLERLRESSFPYAPLRSSADGVVLEGYFQSWRYFADHEQEIRRDLRLARPASGENARLLARMQSENPICLHVRRGDYAMNRDAREFHGLMGLPYYRAALESLGDAALGATCYVFSDEPEWARDNLRTGLPTVFVEHNSVDEPWEDLRLMSACNHFVIANSSLSWWGAWLAQAEHKQVIAPLRWFADPNVDTRDLCPPEWRRI